VVLRKRLALGLIRAQARFVSILMKRLAPLFACRPFHGLADHAVGERPALPSGEQANVMETRVEQTNRIDCDAQHPSAMLLPVVTAASRTAGN